MSKSVQILVSIFAILVSTAFAGVTIYSPTGGTVQGPVNFNASGSTSCKKGVGSMGVYTAPGVLAYVSNGSSLNTSLGLNPGTYNTVVVAWDNCGGAATASVTVNVSNQTGVQVSWPLPNATVSSTVNFVATASTSCSKGVNSMGVYSAPYQLAYSGPGSSMNANVSLAPGTYNAVVQEWDNCGGSSTTPVTIVVGNAFNNVQADNGWDMAGQGPPDFIDCNPCGKQITFSMQQGIKNPSLSGSATQFNIGGTGPYWDVLFNNHLIGDGSTQGMLDQNHSLIPSVHNLSYDVYFFGSNLPASQALEFDLNQFFDGLGFVWGHECRIAGGNEWDVWDPVAAQWIPTGVPCYPNNNAWNHLTLEVERTSGNQLLYKSITLNGVTNTLNIYHNPASYPGWYGITVNYQMDGNNVQTPYSIYLDKLSFTYE